MCRYHAGVSGEVDRCPTAAMSLPRSSIRRRKETVRDSVDRGQANAAVDKELDTESMLEGATECALSHCYVVLEESPKVSPP